MMAVQEDPELISSHGNTEYAPTQRAIPPEEELRTDCTGSAQKNDGRTTQGKVGETET